MNSLKVATFGALMAAAIANAESDAQFKLRFASQLDGATAGYAATSMQNKGTSPSTLIATFEAQIKATPDKSGMYRHAIDVTRYIAKAINEDKARNEKHDAFRYAAEVAALCVSFGGVDSKYLDAKVPR